jgi:hypothetical protein
MVFVQKGVVKHNYSHSAMNCSVTYTLAFKPEVLHSLQAVDQIPPHPKLLAAFCYSRKLRPTSMCSLLHNILVDCQHGFRAKRSCETQLLTLSHELLSNLHSSIQTDLIILDFFWMKLHTPHFFPSCQVVQVLL